MCERKSVCDRDCVRVYEREGECMYICECIIERVCVLVSVCGRGRERDRERVFACENMSVSI